MNRCEPNRWKGLVLGAAGGLAGVLAMQAYWQAVTAIEGQDPRQATDESDIPDTQALDSISLIGEHHKEGESSTAAVGRIAYQSLTGQEPQQETKTTLSYMVHWLISMGMGGTYGAVRNRAGIPDLEGGIALSVALWLFGDELVMPLLGLTKGPTAYPPQLHAHSLGAHLAYGTVSAAVTQLLHRIL